MASTSFNSYIERVEGGYGYSIPFYAQNQAATTSTLFSVSSGFAYIPVRTQAIPTGTSVDYVVPTSLTLSISTIPRTVIFGQIIDMGSLDISTNTFTAGSTMPTKTEGNVSRQTSCCAFAVAETALNATPGTLTVTYTDQDGNTGQSTGGLAMTGSAAIRTAAPLVLASGDYGMTEITAAVRTAGTTPTGTIRFYGVYPLTIRSIPTSQSIDYADFINDSLDYIKFSAGDTFGMFISGTTTTGIEGQINLLGMQN